MVERDTVKGSLWRPEQKRKKEKGPLRHTQSEGGALN